MTERSHALAIVLVLSATALPSNAHAQARIVLPECAEMAHLDGALLTQLLAVELAGSGELTIEIDAALCDAEASHVEVTVTTPERVERERVAVMGEEPAGRARGLALVIAERVHLLTLPSNATPVAEPEPQDEPLPEPPRAEIADEFEVPDLPDPSRRMFGPATPAVEPTPPAAPARPIALPPTIEVVALARLAPINPSGAIGVRSDVHAHVDRYWSLSLGVIATWSHAEHDDLSPHVLIGALSGSVGWTPYRDHVFDLVLSARGEIGAALIGGQGVEETARPWATVGADAGLLLWLHPSLGMAFGMGVSGVIAGTGFVTRLAEPILQLTGLVLDLTLGFRVPLE